MKMTVAEIIKKSSVEDIAKIIGSVVAMHIDGISAEEATKLDYKETLKVLQSEMEVDYQPTNADRIRSMSDEELAELLKHVKSDYQWSNPDYPSEDDFGAWVEWLQEEVEGQHGKCT